MNAFSALLAERAGFRALYLSGAGVANYAMLAPAAMLFGFALLTSLERCSNRARPDTGGQAHADM